MSELLGGGLIPRHQLGEREALLAYLARQRALVCWKVEGMDDAAARAVSTPSGLTVHGVVRHLENVERGWWREHVAGEQGLHFDWSDSEPDAEMRVPEDVLLTDLVAAYRTETRRCDEVIAARSLDDVSAMRDHTVRWVLLHLIEETARHVGHLDLLAEQVDGRVGEEPEGAPAPGVDES